jgi:hypothetical protein
MTADTLLHWLKIDALGEVTSLRADSVKFCMHLASRV